MSNVTNAIVNIDNFKVHENKDGTVDRTKTDVYLHVVDKRDNSIIEVSDVIRMVDLNIDQLDGLFKEFNVLDTQASEALVLNPEFGSQQVFIWLIMTNLAMLALLVIVATLCLSQRTNYRRELKAARVNTYRECKIKNFMEFLLFHCEHMNSPAIVCILRFSNIFLDFPYFSSLPSTD